MAKDSESVEDVAAREHRSKEKWHGARAGNPNIKASFSKMVHHGYQAELLERGVKDASGNQTPMHGFAFRD